MMTAPRFLFLSALLVNCLFQLMPSSAGQVFGGDFGQLAAKVDIDTHTITAYFPSNSTLCGPVFPSSSWKIKYAFRPLPPPKDGAKCFYITYAEYIEYYKYSSIVKRKLAVADEISLVELYTLYNGTNANVQGWSVFDLSSPLAELIDLGPLKTVSDKACSPSASLELNFKGKTLARADCRDDDVRWINLEQSPTLYRGQRIELWGVVNAGNYRFLIRYLFMDDGTIKLQAGATGQNLFRKAGSDQELSFSTHVHLSNWRISLLLGDKPEDLKLDIFDYSQNATYGTLDRIPVLSESAINLEPNRFQRLVITGPSRGSGKSKYQPAYDLYPFGYGRLRFDPPQRNFADSDVWVTAIDRGGIPVDVPPSVELIPALVDYPKPESLAKRRFQIWCNASFLHVPRQEDFNELGSQAGGVALTAWSTIVLHPRGISSSTPLY